MKDVPASTVESLMGEMSGATEVERERNNLAIPFLTICMISEGIFCVDCLVAYKGNVVSN